MVKTYFHKKFFIHQILLSTILSSLLFSIVSCESRASKNKRPNILFAISDDQSFAHTSYAGCTFINTPAFDRIAKEGIYFSNCYAGSPGCAPSRSAIVTGRHHWQNEQSGQHASSWLKKHIPFVDELTANGYATGKTGKGVGPFQFARTKDDSLWRDSDPAGMEHSHIKYTENDPSLFAKGISATNYFENFKYFIDNIQSDEPFFFWYGAREPHRVFEQDSYKRFDKSLDQAIVPDFLPDNDIVRGDLLDYAVEIEWFDMHLMKMLDYLEEIGELDNTIVIVTSDNGMAFPRAKANCYEYGAHVPLAIKFTKSMNISNIIVERPVSFIDFAPSILGWAETAPQFMLPMTGKNLSSLSQSELTSTSNYVFSGRERHSSSRYKNWGYPQRMVRYEDHILIWNIRPERWPAGAPQKFNPKDTSSLLPLYGLDDEGKYMHQSSFTDIDDCPTKSWTVENHASEQKYFGLAHAKRPEFELYNVITDPYCLNNLSNSPALKNTFSKLKSAMVKELTITKDPRIVGPDNEVFDSYLRYSKMRKFPEPSKLVRIM